VNARWRVAGGRTGRILTASCVARTSNISKD